MTCFESHSIVHVHPTLSCNLSCSHCYSSSSPKEKGGLEINSLLKYLRDINVYENYNVLSISGGEPFLYRELERLVSESQSMGYYVQLVSNGMLFNSVKNKRILRSVDSIALSIDGNKELHNKIRNSTTAYDKLTEGIGILKELGIEYGLIHTLTSLSWEHIPHLVQFARENNASLLQLHPIERAGRAVDECKDDIYLSDDELYRIYILVNLIQETIPEFRLHLDLLHIDNIPKDSKTLDLAANNLLDRIIITENGDVLPISYGFTNKLKINSIYDNSPNSISSFRKENRLILRDILQRTISRIQSNEISLFNWTEMLVNESLDITLDKTE